MVLYAEACFLVSIVLFVLDGLGVAPGARLLSWGSAAFAAGFLTFALFLVPRDRREARALRGRRRMRARQESQARRGKRLAKPIASLLASRVAVGRQVGDPTAGESVWDRSARGGKV